MQKEMKTMLKRQDILISVIVPFYNRAVYMRACLDSILKQSYGNFELILLNDGSTDGSLAIAESYFDKRVRLISLEHQGCWKTKNEGIHQAKGEFVVFIDSDDFISQDYLLNGILGIQLNPKHDYYYPISLTITEEDGKVSNLVWKYLNVSFDERWRLVHLFYHNCFGGVPHAGAFIRRDLFERNGYYEDNHINMSDTVYVVKNALKTDFYCLENLKYYYNRQHENQTNKISLPRHETIAGCLYYITQNYNAEVLFPDEKGIDEFILNRRFVDRFMQEGQDDINVKEIYQKYAIIYLKKLRGNYSGTLR